MVVLSWSAHQWLQMDLIISKITWEVLIMSHTKKYDIYPKQYDLYFHSIRQRLFPQSKSNKWLTTSRLLEKLLCAWQCTFIKCILFIPRNPSNFTLHGDWNLNWRLLPNPETLLARKQVSYNIPSRWPQGDLNPWPVQLQIRDFTTMPNPWIF